MMSVRSIRSNNYNLIIVSVHYRISPCLNLQFWASSNPTFTHSASKCHRNATSALCSSSSGQRHNYYNRRCFEDTVHKQNNRASFGLESCKTFIQLTLYITQHCFLIKDEIVGRPLQDLINSDVTILLSQTNRLKDFDGSLSFNRKMQDPLVLHVRASPVACLGRSGTHIVLSLTSAQASSHEVMMLPSIPQAKEPRGSLHSIRRGSFDIRSIASDGLRRTSLAKLSSLPLEAPITKVLSILAQVQENCQADEAKLLDRVIEFLKREGLYSPQIKEIRPEDPVATDLIGALLTVSSHIEKYSTKFFCQLGPFVISQQGPSNVVSSRRSSNESIIRSGSRQSSTSTAVVKFKVPTQVAELLNGALDWDFEIFRLEELTDKHPLVFLGIELFRRFDVFNTFNCDEATFRSWLIVVESHYHSVNTYHNSTHAADVMQVRYQKFCCVIFVSLWNFPTTGHGLLPSATG